MCSKTNNKLIKVCFIAPKAYPLFEPEMAGVFGGAEVDLYYLATELARDENFRVSFIVADYGQPPTETIENVTIIKSLDFRKNPLSGARRIWQALRRANADIYMIKTASPGVPLVAWFCGRYKRSFIYRAASMLESNGTYLKRHLFLGMAFGWSLRRAAKVFVQNVTDRDNLKDTIKISAEVIPNGRHLSPTAEGKRDSVLWVGRSGQVKGPSRFIELARKFPDEKFVMICQRATGDDNYDRLCRQAAETTNLEFHQRVPFHEVGRFFQRAKVLVNTSDSEGFPNTFIQACASGAAVLSLTVNPDDFLNRYSCGLSCLGDMERLAEGLRFMLEKNRYVELGKNGRKYVEDHHDIKKIIERYKQIFFSLYSF